MTTDAKQEPEAEESKTAADYLKPERKRRIIAGRWLRERREFLGKTQREVAEQAGFRYHAFMSQLEHGAVRMGSADVARWARALEIPVKDFVWIYMELYEPDLYAAAEESRPYASAIEYVKSQERKSG